jgi:acetyl-CoA acetyltransferase
MTRASHARVLGVRPVYVRGHGQSATAWTIAANPDLARLICAQVSGERAMAMAGMSHDDIDLVQLYDSFTITVLMTLEALGFCKPGEGAEFVRGGRLGPGGAFPINTSGGGLSHCHPGMLGIFLLIEAVRQLRGEVEPERQVPDVSTVLVHGTGGTLSSGATCVLSVN